MNRCRRRASGVAWLSLFLVATMTPWFLPAYCCQDDHQPSRAEVSACCCASSAPRSESHPEPRLSCGTLGACPEPCCSARSADQALAPVSQISFDHLTRAFNAVFLPGTWWTESASLLTRTIRSDSVFPAPSIPSYLRLQVILC